MGRSKIKPYYEDVLITGIGSEGKSLARIGDKVIFTTHAVPGDVVDLQVTKKKKRYEEANVVRYKRYSGQRAVPFCSHFGICGGCKWQNLPYQNQLEYKQKQVEEQLIRIGRLEIPEVLPILGSADELFYRNKLEFTFSNKSWLTWEEMKNGDTTKPSAALGFHIPGLFDKVFPVTKCWLQPEPSNEIRNFLYRYATSHNLDFFDIKEQTGFLRTVIIRTSLNGEVMVILNLFREETNNRKTMLDALLAAFPGITSLMYTINPKGNDTITDQLIHVYYGTPYITEEMGDLRFRIGPKSFYQTNSRQAISLYAKVREFAGLHGHEIVYDLYTGTGTIACFVARDCNKVIGIEYVDEAIEDAKVNAGINGIANTRFYSGDIKDLLNPAFAEENGNPDVIITDPPRSGMHEDVVKTIVDILPEKIVYVSCHPATQARDISLMATRYTISKVQPVDMFPHTHHVENIVLLNRKA